MKNFKLQKLIAIILCLFLIITNFNFNNNSFSAETTTVDITGLATGTEISHDCNKYLLTKYDTSNHWQQCSICGKIIGTKSAMSLS